MRKKRPLFGPALALALVALLAGFGAGAAPVAAASDSHSRPDAAALAAARVTLGGTPAPRLADPTSISGNPGRGDSGPAAKKDAAGTLTWEVRSAGTGGLLGGATFDVCQTHTYNSATGFTRIEASIGGSLPCLDGTTGALAIV